MAVLGAAVTLACAAPALAGTHGLKYVSSAQQTVTAFGSKDKNVKCPNGLPVVGGGVLVDGANNGATVGDSYPYDSNGDDVADAWSGSAHAPSNATYMFQTVAVCSKSGSFKMVGSSGVTSDPFSEASTQAECPAGTRVVGGGGQVFGSAAGAALASSLPIDTNVDADSVRDNGWLVYEGDNTAIGWKLKAYAICAKGNTSNLAYVETASQNVAAGTQGQLPVECPAGTSVTGGGLIISGTAAALAVGSIYPLDGLGDSDSKPDDGWYGFANNPTATQQSMKTYAVCRG